MAEDVTVTRDSLLFVSSAEADAAKGLRGFYSSHSAGDKEAQATRIVASYADNPRLLYHNLRAKYRESDAALSFLYPWIEAARAKHAARHARAKQLWKVLKLHGVPITGQDSDTDLPSEDPNHLVGAYTDAPHALVDYLMDAYYMTAQELRFLRDWSDEAKKEFITQQAASATAEAAGDPASPRERELLWSLREQAVEAREAWKSLRWKHQETVLRLRDAEESARTDNLRVQELQREVARLEDQVHGHADTLARFAVASGPAALRTKLDGARDAIVHSLEHISPSVSPASSRW
ncbi:hypothetical protein DIPPA_15330 [Diplonema papillatum]|nr:hypothetical protein DIPPA_15330 [Diplonema papillatum]